MKKVLAFSIVIAMCVSVLAGCVQSAQKQDDGSSSVQTAQKQDDGSSSVQSSSTTKSEPVKISWYWNEGGIQMPDDTYVSKQILKDLNIQYVPINPKGDQYEEQLQLLLASGDVPDVITSYKTFTSNLKKWGVIQPIEKYLTQDTIPNVYRIGNNYEIAIKNETQKDGHIWAMPNTNASIVKTTPYIRYDWLQNLGLEVPKTLDELAVVLEKFTKDDPDKNGKNDTVGTMSNEYWGMLDIAFEMGTSPDDLYKDKNGNAILGMFKPDNKDYLKYIRNLVVTGGLDIESSTTTFDQVVEKVKASKVGFLWNFNDFTWNTDMKNVDPKADWRPMQPPKGVYDQGYLKGGDLEREQYCVSVKCENLVELFKLINYMADDKSTADKYDFTGSYWICTYGEEGVNWKVDDKGLFYATEWAPDPVIAEQDKKDNWSGRCGRIQNKFNNAWMLSLPADRLKVENEVRTYPTTYNIPDSDPLKHIDTTAWIPIEEYSSFSQEWMLNKWTVLYYRAILGKVDIDKAWDDFLAEAKVAGLDKIMENTTKSLKDDGILK